MPLDEQNEKKNILDFQFFILRKKTKNQEIVRINTKKENIPSTNESKSLEELEISTRIKNIKESVQRINTLISELRQISDNPNK
jgi:hypothetical protein